MPQGIVTAMEKQSIIQTLITDKQLHPQIKAQRIVIRIRTQIAVHPQQQSIF